MEVSGEFLEKEYDLFLFLGQSNMAGRGITSEQWPQPAPALIPGAGYEYRAVSDPGCLHALEEPFGANENDPEGIYEPGMKTGSMATAFVNACYTRTGIPVIGISASKGGSAIDEWQGTEDYLSDALVRLERAKRYLDEQGLTIRHRFVLFCQGETDGDLGTPPEVYKEKFKQLLTKLLEAGIETCFLVTIGEYNGEKGYDYTGIRQAQLELAEELSDVELVCDIFHTMRARGLMKDEFHYFQQAYNEAGTIAGDTAGELIRNRQLIDDAIAYVKDIFAHDYSGHDFFHTLRVYKMAGTIAKQEKADLLTVQLAALLHDVDDRKLSPETHADKGRAVEFLRSHGVSSEDIGNICDLIEAVSFAGTDSVVPESIEGKCVQDADRLDAIGAVGIARAFAYGGSHHRAIHDPDIPFREHMTRQEYENSQSTSINHFYEKLFLLRDQMNTETAKRIARKRDAYMRAYVEEFLAEWEGMR